MLALVPKNIKKKLDTFAVSLAVINIGIAVTLFFIR